MRILSWNVNHGAGIRRIPEWLASAVSAEAPDVLVCTEYVRGPQHNEFLAALRAIGLRDSDVTAPQRDGANCVLMAAREPLLGGPVRPPADLHPSVPPGFLHAILQESGIHVFGFRMPDFGRMLKAKRQTYEWLTEALAPYLKEPAIIIGDFNTAPDDPRRYGGDQLDALAHDGWQLAVPETGASFYTLKGHPRRIDLALASPALGVTSAEYLWRFRELHPEAAIRRVGNPDHAMLLVDVTRTPPYPRGV